MIELVLKAKFNEENILEWIDSWIKWKTEREEKVTQKNIIEQIENYFAKYDIYLGTFDNSNVNEIIEKILQNYKNYDEK